MTTPENRPPQPTPDDGETQDDHLQEAEQPQLTLLEEYAAALGAADSPTSTAIKTEIFQQTEQPSPADVQRYHRALTEVVDQLTGAAQTRAQIGVGIAVADLYDGLGMDQERDEMLNDMREYASNMGFADIVSKIDSL